MAWTNVIMVMLMHYQNQPGFSTLTYLSGDLCDNCAPLEETAMEGIDSSPPSTTYIRRWTGSALVQLMACCLSGAKPWPEPMLSYCQLDPWEQTSMKFELIWKKFHSWKCLWNCRLRNGGHFVQGRVKLSEPRPTCGTEARMLREN